MRDAATRAASTYGVVAASRTMSAGASYAVCRLMLDNLVGDAYFFNPQLAPTSEGVLNAVAA